MKSVSSLYWICEPLRLAVLCIGISFPAACGQDSHSFETPFVVHRIAPAAQPEQLLLLGEHRLALLRYDTERALVAEPLAIDLPRVKIAAAASLLRPDGESLVIAGATENESGFVAMVGSDGRSKWTKTLTAPILAMDTLAPIDAETFARSRAIYLGDLRGTVLALAIDDGELLWESSLHGKMVTALATLNGDLAASGDWTGKIVLWNRTDGSEVASFQQHRARVTSLQRAPRLPPGGPLAMVSASRDGTVRLWYPQQRRLVRFVQIPQPIVALAWRDNLQFIAATSSGALHTVDLAKAKIEPAVPSGLPYVSDLRGFGDRLLILSGEGPNRILNPVSEQPTQSEKRP